MNTCHSEFGKIRQLYLKSVESSFLSQDFLSNGWKQLNYLSEPDFINAKKEYRSFENLILDSGAKISYFSDSDRLSMDAIYCRDASITTDFGMILCNMGKKRRITEPDKASQQYIKDQVKILGKIKSPGTIEGGDVAWLDHETLAVGRTYRTNDEGIREIKELLEPRGIKIMTVDLPHFRGPSDVFHLMSIFSPVDKDLAVVYSPLMPVRFREELIDRGYDLVEIPEEEYDSMGCNVLAIGPRNCIMVGGNSITVQRLEEKGAMVSTYDGIDISVKGGGGPTCLTRPILREI